MTYTLYLAMTAVEFQTAAVLPAQMAWMACHFSPYSNGLSNLPTALPSGSALILNDRIPPNGHDPEQIARQVEQLVKTLQISRLLLDLQRPDQPLTARIAEAVVEACPCPCAVTPQYATPLTCPVFITPELRKPLKEQFRRWQGRPLWLDAAIDCESVTVTGNGSKIGAAPPPADPKAFHIDPLLRCCYKIAMDAGCVRFTVWRDRQQLFALLEDAAAMGIDCAIGLYQQLRKATAET